MKAELCKSCIHTNVCRKDKNLVGDTFVPGHPLFCDNEKKWKEYEEWEKRGFSCDDYMLYIQPNTHNTLQSVGSVDCIERQAAIDALENDKEMLNQIIRGMSENDAQLCGLYVAQHNQVGYDIDTIERLPSAQPEIIRCKDCKHQPVTNDNYDDDEWDCGFNIEFPDYKCPCQCDDGYYNRLPDDNWFCGNAERRTDEQIW